jgi:hypothetical protein
MRSAPPAIDVGLHAGQRERWLVAGLHAVSAALLATWACAWWELPAGCAAVAGLLGGWCGRSVLVPLQGVLRWDGGAWWYRAPGGVALPLQRVDLMIDLGTWMLLRVPAEGGHALVRPGRWCAITPGDAGSSWHGLRLALYHAPASMPSSAAATPGPRLA